MSVSIYSTEKTLMAWDLLFKVEGSYCGNVRDVFEESYARLLQLLWLGKNFPVQEKVKHLLIARLPVTVCSISFESIRMMKLYELLNSDTKIPCEVDMYDCLARVLQDLRLDFPVRDEMKDYFFESMSGSGPKT